ncbi:LuxR family transcriptional regulator, quorum sensing-dependent transcriptional regulator [Methylobacterium sp. 174MFSha1.1]|uniref:autoinducer binding domain-containing protein n=1 Tax=Methylobacterium sp. 174MFSha1.1 TaxID=1502749 RepID=UPI0008F3D165|nr:autoinducer binding domain-containing protein [Methylobacterium sp. 174MFSha1.1]SFU91185.1 LuxR family transcriptional regulator, quorum sensing-dependent transcriptional regulator [Methylobacterium sp. 174MFSha1.1]
MTVIGQVTLDLVQTVKAAQSTAEIAAILIRAGGIFGYEHFAIAGLPQRAGETLPERLLLMHWPAEWASRYVARGYVRHDPVAAHVRRTTEPFRWSEVAIEPGAVLARRIMDEARAFGLGDGFCVPIHDIDGTESVASFGAPRMDLSEEARAGLHLLGIYAHLASRRLGPAVPARPSRPGGATPCRTRDVACRAGNIAGGTDRETSCEIRLVASGDPVGSLTQCGFRLRSDAA